MSTNETAYAELLFTFGSVYVYELKPKVYDLFNQPVYYWRYKDTAPFYGPFDSIMNCCRHWEASIRGDLPQADTVNKQEVDMTNVIKVDFKRRKRL